MSRTFQDAGALGATIVTAAPMEERPKGSPPSQLGVVLTSDDAEARDAAWRSLIADHSRLLMHVARSVAAEHDGRTVAVVEPEVVRALVVRVLGAPESAFWRVDVPPLTATELSGRAGRWNLRAGRPLA